MVVCMTNIDQRQEAGRARGELFGNIRPPATMIEVKRPIDPDMPVEIESRPSCPPDR